MEEKRTERDSVSGVTARENENFIVPEENPRAYRKDNLKIISFFGTSLSRETVEGGGAGRGGGRTRKINE